MKTKSLLAVIVLMFALGSGTQGVKGANGKGGGKPGGGGGGACSVDSNWSTVFDWVDEYYNQNTHFLGMEMAAIVRGSDILLVATADLGTDPTSDDKSIEVFSFSSGNLTRIHSVPYPADFKAYQELLLGDIDSVPGVDLLLGSPGVNQVRFYSDIAGNFTATQIPAPVEGDTLGTSFGEGLAFGDFLGNNENQIAIGADNYFDGEGRVFIYSADGLSSFLGALSSPDPTGSDRFGSDLATDPSGGGLYVSAKWAAVGKKREAGKVFRFSSLDCDGTDCVPLGQVDTYARGNRNEELGKDIAVTSGRGVAATAGDALAYFTTPTFQFDLPMPGTTVIQHLAAADINSSAVDDLLSGRPNTDPDTGSCWNTGSAFVYLDPSPNQSPITLRSPGVIDANNLFFGWGAAAVSGTVFVSERGRDIDGDGNPEGVIYAFTYIGP